MSQAKVKWKIKAAGRSEGQIETTEVDTPMMKTLIKNGQVEVLKAPKLALPAEAIAELQEIHAKPKPPRARKWEDVKADKDADKNADQG